MSTTEFESWLDNADPDGTEQVYSLYSAVSGEETNGIWEVQPLNKGIYLKVGHVPEALFIASKEAKELFLKILRDHYMDGDDDPDSWYGFKRSMDNPKA